MTPEQKAQEELNERIKIGRSFVILMNSPEWSVTVDQFLVSLQEEMEKLTLTSIPPDKARELCWMAHGRQEFINRFKEQMESWISDASLTLDQPKEGSAS
ncbi:MAG TPA: hypothetical protein PLI01_00370 [Nitrospira sp.]|nr:hypothetical protein [Nitrospira sp.]HNA25213.1 hypothetical protein [Nitrospira sp.]HNI17503.1 hypothetical protein [Nitrospira sp.]